MIDLSRWFNPAAALSTEGEALAACRAGAVGAFVMAANGLFGVLLTVTQIGPDMARLHRETAATLGHQTPAAREALSTIGPAMVYFILGVSGVLALVVAILGVVQWRKPNLVIPPPLGLVALYGLLTTVMGLVNGSAAAAARAGMPFWRYDLSVVVSLVCLLLFYNGLRGARRLRKLRGAG
jgi:hypothetical protein